ncbi:hypothetical protein D3C81_841430 [compost metagenome]
MQQGLHFRINEAVGDRFLETVIDQQSFHAFQRQIGFAVLGHDQIGTDRHVRNIVVAINARDFFNQVFFDFHIETPARRHRQPVIALLCHLTTQTAQNIAHLLAWYHMTNQTIQFFTAQRNSGALRQFAFGGNINNRACLAAADINQQAGSALHRLVL